MVVVATAAGEGDTADLEGEEVDTEVEEGDIRGMEVGMTITSDHLIDER